jgi:hypothetical protein
MDKIDSERLGGSIGGEAQAGSETVVEQAIKYLKIAHEKVLAANSAKTVVERAIKYLKIAHEKVLAASSAKYAAEAELTRYRDEVKRDINIKLLQLLKTVMSQLAAAGQGEKAAEQRANKAEAMVRRLEDELQTLRTRTRPRLVRTAFR